MAIRACRAISRVLNTDGDRGLERMSGRLAGLLSLLTCAVLITACGPGGDPGSGAAIDREVKSMPGSENAGRAAGADADFLWLEEIEGERALAWVKKRNEASMARLKEDPRYESLRAAAEANYTAKDRIPYGQYFGGRIHNFWQDDEHVKGIVRMTTLAEYRKDEPEWNVLLDIDALAEQEGENWVYKGRTCRAREYDRCLVSLSRGGGDAVEMREFDTGRRSFVEDGFSLPEAKTRADWLDDDTLLVATDLGEGSLTTSGYPRIVKKWSRGSSLEASPTLLEVGVTDILVVPTTINRPEGDYTFLIAVPEFFRETVFFLQKPDKISRVPFPADIDFRGVFNGKVLGLLRSDWTINSSRDGKPRRLQQGSLVSMDLKRSLSAEEPVDAEIIHEPAGNEAIADVAVSRDTVLVSVMKDVNGVLFEYRYRQSSWQQRRLNLPDKGSIELVTADPMSGVSMVRYESFLVPDTLYLIDRDKEPKPIKSLPPRFNSADYVSEQRFATSRDGTRIPYYLVHGKNVEKKGKAPTLLTAYGGFEVPLAPEYFGALGIEWLKAGGVYVLANIRGGGEYGPAWHKAAILENRQRAYDDFIAVSEALIESGITSSDRLAIRGGSNGGLLVMAVTAQRPELYKGVICAVPLLDMLRYHKLSAGASWMAEYGDPDIPEQREFISKYSPYQNIVPGVDYPEIFFWTNTKDDRVHPSHARRMVAKMLSQGHQVLYFENTEGGHGGGADPLALSHTTALELVYLKQQLMD